jgi:hypothetical protein
MFNLRVSHVKFKDLECPILKVRGITCPINMIFSLFINLRHVLVSINPLFLKLCCVQKPPYEETCVAKFDYESRNSFTFV